MNKSRLEAFSDGVFAIVITLLILDVHLPNTKISYENLPSELYNLLPNITAYVMSFIVIGIYWMSHHLSFSLITKVDRTFLWLNILLLLFVSFIPFPASLLGRFPFKAIPIMLYGATLCVSNLTGFIMLLYIKKHPHLASHDFTKETARRQTRVYLLVNGAYVLAIILASFYPVISYLLYALVILSLVIRHIFQKS